MDKNTLYLSSTGFQPGNSAGWYRAYTLRERIPYGEIHPSLNTEAYEAAEDLLLDWKQQTPFDTESWFAERLTMDMITEEDLLKLLAESDEELQERLSNPPAWLVTLAVAFANPPSEQIVLPQNPEQSASQQFLRPFSPLLQWGAAQLREGIQQIHSQTSEVPFDVSTLCSLFMNDLAGLLLSKVSRTLVLEMHVAKLRDILPGETPQARFESYIQYLSQPEVLRGLLEEYCVLARQLVLSIERWINVSLELTRRLATDWPTLRATFTPQSDPGLLIKVSGGAGDLHRGGRSVNILEFSSGFRLVYKPKSTAIDQHFQELLVWLNAHGQQPMLLPCHILNCGEYGWAEFITSSPCSTQEEIKRFYERQGSYIALFYALEATDMHYENVLAAGEHPMLVDLEALFHPRIMESLPSIVEHPTHHAFRNSVLHVGLLPFRLYALDESDGVDLSGLGGEAGQTTPFAVPHWENAGTDEMRLIRKKSETESRQNRPTLNGTDVHALDYCEQIILGFTTTYQLLIAHREELQQDILPRFTDDEVRFLARSTRMYSSLLYESFHPNVLRDALKRERTFDRLWFAVRYRSYLTQLIEYERADLEQGDIPFFSAMPGSRDVLTSQGKRVENFFAQTGLECVYQRLADLSEDDLTLQRWMIQAAFTSVTAATRPEKRQTKRLQSSQMPVTHERLLDAARMIGDHICELAIWREGAVGWLGVAQNADLRWDLMPADISLYHGNAGIALFLAYLGSITGEQQYTLHARAALTTIRYDLELVQKYPRFVDIGGFRGLGSVIYLFAHLGTLWNEPELFGEVESLVALLNEKIADDDKLSIVSGAAGAIACLLTLYSVAPSESLLQVARRCGEHLLTTAQPMEQGLGWQTISTYKPLTGFINGAAGMAYSLLWLAQVSGEERFQQAGLAAFAYERSLFSPEQNNWPVLFTDPTKEADFRMSWSYGAPGIGLSRLASLQFVDDPAIRAEIAIALKTTLAHGFGFEHTVLGANHSAGSGDAGILETLLVATQVLSGSEYQEPLENLTGELLASIDAHGYIAGVPLNVETSGLMIGLAGIGYELLRLAEPEQMPSVLLLAPPPLARAHEVKDNEQ